MSSKSDLTVTVRVKDLLNVYKILHQLYDGVPRRSFHDWLHGRTREEVFTEKIEYGKRQIDHMLSEFGVQLQVHNSIDTPNVNDLVKKMGGKKWQKNT